MPAAHVPPIMPAMPPAIRRPAAAVAAAGAEARSSIGTVLLARLLSGCPFSVVHSLLGRQPGHGDVVDAEEPELG